MHTLLGLLLCFPLLMVSAALPHQFRHKHRHMLFDGVQLASGQSARNREPSDRRGESLDEIKASYDFMVHPLIPVEATGLITAGHIINVGKAAKANNRKQPRDLKSALKNILLRMDF